MKGLSLAAFSGALFGVGLAVSGMTKPSKVVGFLDLAGAWDPSLAFVMMGAIAVHFFGLRAILRRKHPLMTDAFHVPTRQDLDRRLVVGSAIFGVGWALGGFCPGPGLVAAASGSSAALVFVAGLVGGIVAERTVR